MKYLFVLIGLITFKFTSGQQISTVFDHVVIEEKFKSMNKTWPQIFNTENIGLSQPGHYEMRRLNEETGNFVFPAIKKEPKSFEVVLSMGFTKNNTKLSTAGVLVNSDQDKGTGILFELRKDRSYRVSNLTEDGPSYYTNATEDGWVKDKQKILAKKNIVRVVTERKRYDLYINDHFVYTFTELSNEGGKSALFIGPNSHAYYYSFVIRTKSPKLDSFGNVSVTNKENKNSLAALTTRIKLQQNEIDRLKGMQENDANNIAEIRTLENTNQALNQKIQTNLFVIDSLMKDNTSLTFFKNSLVNAPDGESILALSNTIEKLRLHKNKLNLQVLKNEAEFKLKDTKMEELISTNVLLNKQIKSLGSQIQFLIRQMDWMNKKLQSDSTHIIDTLRDKGQGYILPPRKLFKLPKMHLPNLNFAFNKA